MAMFGLLIELTGELLVTGVGSAIRRLYSRTWLSRNLFIGRDLQSNYHQLLHSHFKFYRALPAQSQKLFRRRIRVFVKGRKFHGRGGLIVTEEMKVLLSATAVKITFGLDHFVFDTFNNIFIYPEVYYSKNTGNMHKGETHPVGAVVFSWKDFLQGIENEEDNLNLGLHEFSHAFVLELKNGNIPDEVLTEHFLELKTVIFKPEVRKLVVEHGYLRAYAEENYMEFFAVCIESYFETPDQFAAQMPVVYRQFCKMLNQDTHQLYLRAQRTS